MPIFTLTVFAIIFPFVIENKFPETESFKKSLPTGILIFPISSNDEYINNFGAGGDFTVPISSNGAYKSLFEVPSPHTTSFLLEFTFAFLF